MYAVFPEQLMDELSKLIAAVTEDLPSTLLGSLSDDLLRLPNQNADTRQISSRLPGSAQRILDQIFELSAKEGIQANAIALALNSAFQAHARWRSAFSVEMVWTGPSPANTSLRRTDQALLEVIKHAKERLWVVSFAAYRVRPIIDAINAAANRGAMVTLILESSDESEGKLSYDQIVEIRNELVSQCSFYVWPTEKREPNKSGRKGLLHAKCALADGQHLFVSSANLTEAAMRRNIELGVLMKSQRHAKQVEDHLKWLLESDTLERMK